MFAVPFSEVAEILDRSPDAVRQLVTCARPRRVRGAAPLPHSDLTQQRRLVSATDRYALDGHRRTLERQSLVLTKLAAAAVG